MTLSRRPRRRRGSGLVWLFLAPSLLLFLLYRVLPLGWNVVLSFEQRDGARVQGGREAVQHPREAEVDPHLDPVDAEHGQELLL